MTSNEKKVFNVLKYGGFHPFERIVNRCGLSQQETLITLNSLMKKQLIERNYPYIREYYYNQEWYYCAYEYADVVMPGLGYVYRFAPKNWFYNSKLWNFIRNFLLKY